MKALRRIIPIFILAVFGAIIFYFCDNTIWRSDDIRYGYLFTEQHHTLDHDYDEYDDKIENVDDIINSQKVHYQNVNGRLVAHSIVQYFCSFVSQRVFAIINAITSILLIIIVLKFGHGSLKSASSLLTIVLLVYLSLMTRMSPAYQINYIWMFSFTLTFVWMFFRYESEKNIFILIGLAVFSAIAGNGHEGINVGIGAALIIYWLSHFKKCTISQYIMAICFGCGLLILCLAPANFVRLNNDGPVDILDSLRVMLYSFRSVYLLFIIVLYKKLQGKLSFSQIYADNSFFWNAMIISMIFVFALGVPGRRSVFGIELLAIIIAVRLLNRHSFNTFWTVVSSMSLLIILVLQIARTHMIKEQYRDILRQYESSSTGDVFTSVILSETDGFFVNPFMLIPINAYSNDRAIESFKKSMHSRYAPEKPLINVWPDYLQGKDSLDIGNQVVPYGDGIYLLVQSKLSPGRFYMNRSINLLGFMKRDYEPLELRFDNVVKETDKWRARLVDESDYTIMHLSDNVISVDESIK